jgi:hypothetical protein
MTLRVLTLTGAGTVHRLHGTMHPANGASGAKSSIEEFLNPLRPIKITIVDGRKLSAGDRVTIRPQNRADAMDLVLAGNTAIFEALEEDAERQAHLAVVIEDDPGCDMGVALQSGHRFFYRSDEVKPLPINIKK